jgi:hypothetical protein
MEIKYPMPPEMCTKGPSLPKHMPVATAKMDPTPLTPRTLGSKKRGMSKPERIVLISGIPVPAAMYMVFPGAMLVLADGKFVLVVVVKLAATTPNSRESPVYIAYDEPKPFDHGCQYWQVPSMAQHDRRLIHSLSVQYPSFKSAADSMPTSTTDATTAVAMPMATAAVQP